MNTDFQVGPPLKGGEGWRDERGSYSGKSTPVDNKPGALSKGPQDDAPRARFLAG